MTTIVIISPRPNDVPDVEVVGNDPGIDQTALQQAILSQLQGSSGTDTLTSG